jgi:hypothetical protein
MTMFYKALQNNIIVVVIIQCTKECEEKDQNMYFMSFQTNCTILYSTVNDVTDKFINYQFSTTLHSSITNIKHVNDNITK